MTRISIYAVIPFILVSLFFNTPYFDVLLMCSAFIFTICLIRRKHISKASLLLAFTMLAVFLCNNAYYVRNKSYYELLGKPITLNCTVDETPVYKDGKIQFTARMNSALNRGTQFDLSEKVMVFITGDKADVAYGDSLSFKTILQKPSTSMNTGGFNYENYLRAQKINVVCTAYDFSVINNGKDENVSPLLLNIFRTRSYLMQKCDSFFEKDISSFIKAFLLGYSSDISDTVKSDFSRSGISHVISISGMHLSVFMIMLNTLLRSKRFKYSNFIIPVLNILIALFLTALTGFSPSMKRASIMLIITNCYSMIFRENDGLQTLSFALLILMLDNPFAIFDPRLSLSAVAVLGLISFYNRLCEKLKKYIKNKSSREIIATSLSAQIITLPLSAFYFNSISILSLITNLLILPLTPFLMGVGIAFLISPFSIISNFLSGGMWLWVKFILMVSHLISSIPFSQIYISFDSLLLIIILCLVIFISLKKTITCKYIYVNLFCFILSVGALLLLVFPIKSSDFKITAINAGQGDCTLINFPSGKTMLIDGGSGVSYSKGEKENIITPYLIQNNVRRIDYAVVSHYHSDHLNGMLSIAENFDIGCIIAPNYYTEEDIEPVKLLFEVCNKQNIPLYFMENGYKFSPDEHSSFTVFNPSPDIKYNSDDLSLVARVDCYGKSLLLTGDIDYYTKNILMESNHDIDIDILKAPHHGDYTPLDSKFLEHTSPDFVYLCVGKGNLYGHPKKQTIYLYDKNLIPAYRTDEDGTIVFKIDKSGNINVY